MSPQERGYRLFVGNLPPTVDSAKLREVFGPCTPLNAKVPTSQGTGQPQGFGHVDFASEEEMREAQLLMNGFLLDGIAMSVHVDKLYTGSGSMKIRKSSIALEAEAATTRRDAESKSAEISTPSRRPSSGSSCFWSSRSLSGGKGSQGLSSSKNFSSSSEGRTRQRRSKSGADTRSWSLLGSLSFRRSPAPEGREQKQAQLDGSRRKGEL